MRTMLKKIPVLLAFATASCGAVVDFDDVRAIDAKGRDFNAALAREYKTLALYELDKMDDLVSAFRFRKKAVASAAGDATAPEDLDDWTLPYRHRPEMAAARARLVKALGQGAGFMPEVAAGAQASFDCWVEQQEEDFQLDDIQKCRDGFYAQLTLVERGLAAAEAVRSAAVMTPAAATAQPAVPAAPPGAFTLLFDFDRYALTDEHARVLDAIAQATREGQAVRLLVSGHADRAGPEPYNQTLSEKRADAIRQALVERGIAAGRLAVAAYGEKRPRVATPDGARAPLNRRVEIVFGPAPAL